MRFSLVDAQPQRLLPCFDNVMDAMKEALEICGHEVVPYHGQPSGRPIVFGGNNGRLSYPGEAIIFNAEQVASLGREVVQNLEVFKSHTVWDYSTENVKWFKAHGVENAVLCPIGYVPSMERISQVNQDVDVLFYGSLNDRRNEILCGLEREGLFVKRLVHAYGEVLDSWIARAKIVLNIHFYDKSIFEVFRVSHLLANKKCVVSEDGSMDEGLEDFGRRTCTVVPVDQLAKTCVALKRDEKKRRACAERGYEEFKKINFADSVGAALTAHDTPVGEV